MLSKSVCIKPDLLSLPSMAMLKNPQLVVGWNFIPPANMVKVTSLMRLRALFVMEAKEGTVLFGETGWKQIGNRGSFFGVEKACFCEVQRSSTLLEFLLLRSSLMSWGAGRGRVRFKFFDDSTNNLDSQRHDVCALLDAWVCIPAWGYTQE